MNPKDRAIVAHWTARLAVRKALAAAARKRYMAHPTPAAKATLLKRRAQVSKASAVIARHAGHAAVETVSDAGVLFVARAEGFRSAPYRDAVGVWTIGYGETRGVGPGTPPWTELHARETLRLRLNRDYLAPVLAAAKLYGLTLTQSQADALTSLAYNVGAGIFAPGHTISEAMRSGSRPRMANAFLVYDMAGGHVLPGLLTRRKAERAMFLS